jgi:hypothetical protein
MVTRDEELKWAYLLDPCFELTNSAGKPLTDGYIEVYIAGTRNKYYCASDFAGTLHPFQIPLDSLGSNIVLANPDNAYDVYVYNRYGNLIMSRYNVTPADGGAIISNTERINELEETLVSAVTGLQGQIDDINDALENKKDKQEPYSVTLTPTQTVSAIIQNENGEMEVIYQEIDLPEEVPNVDIVSPASTLNITTHIDEETNTKTFSIDLSDLGHLEYGQYMATEDVITGANMYRIKGNLDTTLDGKIKLHKGNSYHITVRGAYVCTDISNSLNTLNYIEYSTFTPFQVNVDNTITDPQNFEISYDIFKLSNDTDYYIAFAASAGKVSNLTVEIHSLSNLSILDPDFKYQEGWGINIVSSVISVDPDIFNDYTTHTDVYESIVTAIDFVTGAMPTTQVQSDWAQDIVTAVDYIKNKPTEYAVVAGDNIGITVDTINQEIIISASATDLSDYTTHEDVNDAIVTAIGLVTGMIPDAQVQSDWDETDESSPAYIQNKPDLDIYATHDEVVSAVSSIDLSEYTTHTEVYEATVTAVQTATGLIPELPEEEEVEFEEINLDDYALASAIPDVSDFTTHTEVYEAVVTGVQLATSVIPDPLEAGQYVSIVDNTITVTGLQPEGDYATNTDVYDATVTAVQVATGAIPDSEEVEFEEINLADYALASAIPDVSDFTTHSEVNEAIVTAVNYVTSIIPDAQVQSDWDETDTSDPSYIQNKPDLDIYVTHDELIEVVSAITGIGDYGQFYSTAVSGAAVMARTKGTIDVTDDGKIKLKKGSSYHVTVRGRYNQTTPNNVYSSIAYIEYITNNNININVDKSITESQFFEISYDLYKLNSDSNYYVFFSGLEGTVNDLFIEIHAIGSVGAGVSGGAGAEYDAGWGIQILNNVISVDPSIFNDYVTENELVTAIQSVVTAIPTEQVQSDWTETDITDPAYIQNKPDNYNVVAGDNITITVSGSELIIAASGNDLSDYATDAEVNSAIVTAINYVTGIIPDAQVQSDWTEDNTTEPSYIKHKPEEYDLVAGENIEIDIVNNSVVISASGTDLTGYATETDVYNAVVTGVQAATGLIPDVSDMATQTWVNNQGFLTSVPDNYATDTEVSEAIASSVTDFVTEEQVTALIPDSEEVDFEELDITQFAQVSAIPVVTGFATKSELSDVEATIPTVQLNGDDQVTAINNHEIAGTGGTTYTAGDYISIENDEISVTGLEPLPEIVEMDALEIKAGTNIAIVKGVSDITISVTGIEIPDVSDFATHTEVYNAVVTGVQVATGLIPELPDTEDVTFEEVNLANYALASAIPDVTSYATHTEVYNAVVTGVQAVTGLIPDVSDFVTDTEVTTEITEAVSGKQDLLTGITDVQVVTGLPVSPTQDVLYLIVEA